MTQATSGDRNCEKVLNATTVTPKYAFCWVIDSQTGQSSVWRNHWVVDFGALWRPGQSPAVLLLCISEHSLASVSLATGVLGVESPNC